jgi:hypothetical protein
LSGSEPTKLWYHTQLHPQVCPACSAKLGAVTGMSLRSGETTVPVPGALVMCTECFTMLVFTADLGLRRATDGEAEALDPTLKQLLELRKQYEARKKPWH